MARGDKVDFRFHIAKAGFFRRLPILIRNTFVSEHSDPVAEVKLMRAVLDQVLHDLGAKSKTIRIEAEEWVDLKNDDFHVVCELAELDPNHTYWTIKLTLDGLAKSKAPMKNVLAQFNASTEDDLIKEILVKGVKDAKCYSPAT